MMKRNLRKNTVSLALAGTVILGTIAGVKIGMNANSNSYWTKSNGYWYYMDNGDKKTGWLNDNGTWYYLKDDGTMATGWILDKGNWYYLYSNGSMAHDTTIDGYYLNNSGAWTTSSGSSSTSTGGVRIGSELLTKLYELGFYDGGYDTMVYNPYGQSGLSAFDVMHVSSFNTGDCDISITLLRRTSDGDEKLKSILNMIVSNNGNELYDKIISNNSQTVYLDGRKIEINSYDQHTTISFSTK